MAELAIDHEKIMSRAAELIAIMSLPDALWTVKDCAAFLRVSERHFGDKLAAHHSFPMAVQFPSDDPKGKPLRKWRAAEVKAWANVNRD